MAFMGFTMLGNPEFQQKWAFRNRDVDSSSDDAKSDSTMKKHELIPCLIPPENEDLAQSPIRQCDGIAGPEKGHGIKTPNLKEKSVKQKKKKKEATENEKRGADRQCKKKKCRKVIACDNGSMDDLRKFRESLVHELRIERESLFGWMKDEMSKLAGRNGKQLKKSDTSSRKAPSRPPGKSSRGKQKAEVLETAKRSKFSTLEKGPQQGLNGHIDGGKIPCSATLVEKGRGESSELNHHNSGIVESSSFNFPSRITGNRTDSEEMFGYYHMLMQDGRWSGFYPNQTGPNSNNISIQTVSQSPFYRDTGRGFTGTMGNGPHSENPPGDEGNVLGLLMNGGPPRFPVHGNSFI